MAGGGGLGWVGEDASIWWLQPISKKKEGPIQKMNTYLKPPARFVVLQDPLFGPGKDRWLATHSHSSWFLSWPPNRKNPPKLGVASGYLLPWIGFTHGVRPSCRTFKTCRNPWNWTCVVAPSAVRHPGSSGFCRGFAGAGPGIIKDHPLHYGLHTNI